MDNDTFELLRDAAQELRWVLMDDDIATLGLDLSDIERLYTDIAQKLYDHACANIVEDKPMVLKCRI